MRTDVGRAERMLRSMAGGKILGPYGALPEPWRYLTLVGLLDGASELTGRQP